MPIAKVQIRRRAEIALNLYDAYDDERLPEIIRQCLRLADKLDSNRDSVFRADKDRLDETAIPFICPTLEAACICDVIRERDRNAGVYPCRVYVRRVGAWERVPHAAILTEVVDGVMRLSRQWFKVVETEEQVETKRLTEYSEIKKLSVPDAEPMF